ncbi:MAG: hypothetical protein ABSC19_19870, partial [Syntrophorhabdales bacterium]
ITKHKVCRSKNRRGRASPFKELSSRTSEGWYEHGPARRTTGCIITVLAAIERRFTFRKSGSMRKAGAVSPAQKSVNGGHSDMAALPERRQ